LRRRVNKGEELSRERIAAAGLAVLAETGLDGLTVRKVAAVLGVQHGALYWHVRNRQDLLDEVAQALLAREFISIEPLANPEDWQAWLLALAQRMRRAMLAQRDGAAIVATCQSKTRVEMFSVLGEAMLTALRSAGFSALDAFDIQLAMLGYTLGLTAQEQATIDPAVAPEAARRFPVLTESKQVGFSAHGTGDALFAAGLGLLLSGAATLRGKSSNKTK
jgi:TetR/AcrR family tetracycline transcriptional repressor